MSPVHALGSSAAPDLPDAGLAHALQALVDTAVAAGEELEEQVPPTHLRALGVLRDLGPAHVSALATAMDLVPSTASRLSDRLTAAGLITRGASPTNRRATLLELSPAGVRVLDDLDRLRAARLGAVLARMDPPARDALLDGARAFAEAARRGDPAERD